MQPSRLSSWLHYVIIRGMVRACPIPIAAILAGTKYSSLLFSHNHFWGISAGLKSLEKVGIAAKKSLGEFRPPLKDMPTHPHLLQISPNKRQAIQVHRDVMVEILERVEGYRTELKFCEKNEISFQEWEKIGEGCKDTQWICIIPQKEHMSD